MSGDDDRPCLDCATGRHRVCLEDDHNPPGRRECCCGLDDDKGNDR